MPYSVRISSDSPACFLFLIDQSKSMAESAGGPSLSVGVSAAVNRVLYNLVLKSVRGASLKDRFFVGLIGYGASVGSAFGGSLAGETILPISKLAQSPLRMTEVIETAPGGSGTKTVKKPIWLEPVGSGKTPMTDALTLAAQVIRDFLGRFPNCYPPIVLNVTDGKPTDGDPRPAATALQQLASSDGTALLFNLHLSALGSSTILYPAVLPPDSDPYARLLFAMSSPLPNLMLQLAKQQGYRVQPGSRGFAFNADLSGLVQFLDVGTATSMAGVKS